MTNTLSAYEPVGITESLKDIFPGKTQLERQEAIKRAISLRNPKPNIEHQGA